jgi:nickel-dependent lactate racemase
MSARTVTLPWGAWHGDGSHDIKLPESWDVEMLAPLDGPALSDAEIGARLSRPVDAPPLSRAAAGCRNACVVTDDLARPTKVERPLRVLLERLEAAGIPRDRLTVLVATGTHPVLDAADLRLKVGRTVADNYRVECHDASGDLVGSGLTYGDRELRLNARFLRADLRVLVGSVIPHPFAGFSAGAKLVIPGLCDVDATERTHKFVLMGLRGAKQVGDNPFRAEIERLVSAIGIQWTMGIVPNRSREPALLVAGDLVGAHREACVAATRLYRTPLKRTLDCLVLNAYPKDVDLVQSQNALGPIQRITPPAVREGGIIVVTTAATRGVGGHGLFAPGGRTYREPVRIRALGDRAVWLYAPSLSEDQARSLHWKGYPFFRDAGAMATALESTLGPSAAAGVMPAACLQWAEDLRSASGSPALHA